jgi:hypothetical protein
VQGKGRVMPSFNAKLFARGGRDAKQAIFPGKATENGFYFTLCV